jgi:succinoglycan biosynthesis protein ExoM
MTRVLVGIPTHKRPELLRACLESIEAQTGVSDVVVFVADNDPNGREGFNLVQSLDYKWPISAEVVEERGISAVRNAILRKGWRAGVDAIAMIDDDETAAPDWLAKLLAVQAEFGADVVGGPVYSILPPSTPERIRRSGFFQTQERESGPVDVINASNNFLLTIRCLFETDFPQFLDEFGLTGGGDTEYFMRLRARGAWFAWANDAKVSEPVPPSRLTARWILTREFRYGNCGFRLVRLYRRPRMMRLLRALSVLATSPLRFILALHPRDGLHALRHIAYAAGVVASAAGYTFGEYEGRHPRT